MDINDIYRFIFITSKRGALGVVQLIILYMLRSQIYTPYDTQEMAHYIVSMKYILIYVIGVFFLFKYVKH